MWTCTKCGEDSEETFHVCWKCSTPRAETLSDDLSPIGKPPKRRLRFKMFRGTWASWEQLFQEAADFANELGPERVVSISHSEDKDDGVVAVWYWAREEEEEM